MRARRRCGLTSPDVHGVTAARHNVSPSSLLCTTPPPPVACNAVLQNISNFTGACAFNSALLSQSESAVRLQSHKMLRHALASIAAPLAPGARSFASHARRWSVYLSGEIHTDWREKIAEGCDAAKLPVDIVGPNPVHADSDDCGALILGDEENRYWYASGNSARGGCASLCNSFALPIISRRGGSSPTCDRCRCGPGNDSLGWSG